MSYYLKRLLAGYNILHIVTLMERATDNNLSVEELSPVDIETLLKEKGYYDDEIHDLLQKDILFLSSYDKFDIHENAELITPETVEIEKLLSNKVATLKINFPLDKKGHRYAELLHTEIYIGVIYFLNSTAWDISKGIISSWLNDKSLGFKNQSKTLKAVVEIQIKDIKKQRTYHFKYTGPADKVAEIIKNIEIK